MFGNFIQGLVFGFGIVTACYAGAKVIENKETIKAKLAEGYKRLELATKQS